MPEGQIDKQEDFEESKKKPEMQDEQRVDEEQVEHGEIQFIHVKLLIRE